MKNLLGPILVITIAVLTRLFPHAPNFVPIGAMALFGGVYLPKKYSIFILLLVMLISDYLLLYINPYSPEWINLSRIYMPTDLFHSSMFYVYASFGVYYLIGRLISKRKTIINTGIGTLAGSIQFFFITNAAVWMNGAYARDLSGLWQSLIAGIPFFRNTIAGDLFYTGAFFACYELVRMILAKKAPVHSHK